MARIIHETGNFNRSGTSILLIGVRFVGHLSASLSANGVGVCIGHAALRRDARLPVGRRQVRRWVSASQCGTRHHRDRAANESRCSGCQVEGKRLPSSGLANQWKRHTIRAWRVMTEGGPSHGLRYVVTSKDGLL